MNHETSRRTDTSVALVTSNPPSRGGPTCVYQTYPSPTRDLRGMRLFQAISRRLRRRREEEEDGDVSQSSTDSEDRSSGLAGGKVSRSKKCPCDKKGRCLHRSASCTGSDSGLRHLHCTGSTEGSSSGSDVSSGHVPRLRAPSTRFSSLQRRSSVKEVFQSLTRSVRSHSASCASSTSSNTDCSRRVSDSSVSCEKKKKKSILRAPVSYTYVRGLSGLPTQRVPRTCVYLPSVVCCESSKFGTQHHLPGLSR
jgi:hypothetical protein